MTLPCTILIPTKDRPNLLRRAVKSALDAAPGNSEVIVIDDKSNPPAQIVLEEFDDPRLVCLVNGDKGGAAAARNLGMKSAKGEVVFFLDDDDEFMADYCRDILDNVVPNHHGLAYGFSAYLVSGNKSDGKTEDTIENNKLDQGIIADTAPFRRRICGFGMGFWIKRDVFEELGPIDEAMATNEDTEYLCRLIDAGKTAWFSAKPGVRVHQHSAETAATELGHVTSRIQSADRAQSFLTIYQRYHRLMKYDKQARQHIAHRYIKLATKSGMLGECWKFAGTLPNLSERLSARYYALINFTAYRLSGKHSKA